MNIIRPLQISFNHQVMEQHRTFYFTASASLGINLQSGEELLDLNYLKDMFECMGKDPLPDPGMPKPNGEFLVSGSFFPPGQQPVQGGKVTVQLDNLEKNLHIFGKRQWDSGVPTNPELFTSMPIDYSKAFGGKEFEKNPDGIGFNDGLLPCIEDPQRQVGSPGDSTEPAGLGPLSSMLPQRMKYQGTYDSDYLHEFFPGYPGDHSWNSFLCAPQDQWIKGYYTGEESFSLHNLHPKIPIINGRFPGLYPRCFLREKTMDQEFFQELPLHLDTIWFFPEKLLGILIFRGVIEVKDDEAATITDVLCAYEKRSGQPRSWEYYHQALEKRKQSDDSLLKNLNTHDLIPEDHKSAMELLMGMATSGDADSPLDDNIKAKTATIQKMVDEKIEEAIQQTEKTMENTDIPDKALENIPDDTLKKIPGEKEGLDLRKLMAEKPDVDDPDLKQLNNRLEAILPGITSGDPKKLEMKHFSFNKIGEITKEVEVFSAKKKRQGDKLAAREIDKARAELAKQKKNIDHIIEERKKSMAPEGSSGLQSLEDAKKKIEESIQAIDDLSLDAAAKPMIPLPRINVAEIKNQIQQVEPQFMLAMHHLKALKDMGRENEQTIELEKQLQNAQETIDSQTEEILAVSESGFREGYIMTAHFMDDGLSPHKNSLDEVKERFLAAVAGRENVSGGDWACIDLSGEDLAGIDLSNCYLEQINFSGANLKGADFSGAILARATLEKADLSDANFAAANIGAVQARRANFTGANLKSATMSRGDFSEATFSRANLEDIQSLEIKIDRADFSEAHMAKITFLQLNISAAVFTKADLSTSVFLQCTIKDCDFREALLSHCTFVDSMLNSLCFDKGDLTGVCFAGTDPEKASTENLSFKGTCLQQANFQDMDVSDTDFTYADLKNSFFSGANLSGADLSHAQAQSAQFRKSILRGAKMDNINLDQGSLAKADLTYVSLRGANLYGVDFLRAQIGNSDLRNTNLDRTLIEHLGGRQ